MSGFAVDELIELTATGQRGTVVETRGTMYNDTAVLVAWDDQTIGSISVTYEGAERSASWEDPANLRPCT